MLNKWIKIIISAVVVVGVMIYAGHSYVNHVERKRTIVKVVDNTNQAKVLFFYRDNCSDCQSIFHQIYWHNVISHDIIFINMNQQKNRRYISKYSLTSVPTFINGNKRYSGTNLDRINKVLGE